MDDLRLAIMAILLASMIPMNRGTVESVCDQDDDWNKIQLALIQAGACRFMIVDEKVLEHLESTTITHDVISKICEDRDAYLPIVKEREDNMFLGSYMEYAKTRYSKPVIILGIKKVGTSYMLDNGKPMKYEPKWGKTTGTWLFTAMQHDTTWLDVDKPINPQSLAIVCEQKYEPREFPIEQPKFTVGNICSDENADPQIIRKTVYNNAIRFFVLRDGTRYANQLSRVDDDPQLDIRRAIKICANHNATLPMVKHEDDELFLRASEIFHPPHHKIHGMDPTIYIALGLIQINNSGIEYQWQDGSPLSYEPKEWRGKQETAKFTVQAIMESEWRNEPVWLGRVAGVICQQGLTTPKVQETTEHVPFAKYKGNNCHTPEMFRNNVHVFKSSICMFIPVEAQEYTNATEQKTVKFEINTARKICANYNSTLPFIRSKEEADAISTLFAHQFLPQPYPSIDIALGLRQVKSREELNYFWDDGSALENNPSWWQGRETLARFTVLKIQSQYSWQNIGQLDETPPIAVICQQLMDEPMPTPSPKTPSPTTKVSSPSTTQAPEIVTRGQKTTSSTKATTSTKATNRQDPIATPSPTIPVTNKDGNRLDPATIPKSKANKVVLADNAISIVMVVILIAKM